MTVRRRWMVVGAVVATIGAGIAIGIRGLRHEFVPVTVGSRAPDFRAVTVDAAAQVRTLADFRGGVTVLNVWATYCAPCRLEMPSFQRLAEAYRNTDLRIVAVSVDAPGMEQPIRDFASELGLTFDILYDSPGAIQRHYMTTGVPETFVIGRDGVIRHKQFGHKEWDAPSVRALLDQLLAEPPS